MSKPQDPSYAAECIARDAARCRAAVAARWAKPAGRGQPMNNSFGTASVQNGSHSRS